MQPEQKHRIEENVYLVIIHLTKSVLKKILWGENWYVNVPEMDGMSTDYMY